MGSHHPIPSPSFAYQNTALNKTTHPEIDLFLSTKPTSKDYFRFRECWTELGGLDYLKRKIMRYRLASNFMEQNGSREKLEIYETAYRYLNRQSKAHTLYRLNHRFIPARKLQP
jgi:hypothetical protein